MSIEDAYTPTEPTIEEDGAQAFFGSCANGSCNDD
jgi:hypothetical protein